jgi:hypothetical protein
MIYFQLVLSKTCFMHYYAHHQELTTILLVTTCGVRPLGCWWSEVRCRVASYASGKGSVSTHHVSEIDRSFKHSLTVVQYQRDSRLRGDQLPAINDREWYEGIVFTAKWPVKQATLSTE